MAQYYQIVGQGPSLTLEDLQRYCPNICLDGIIVNQEDQQYGQQQVVVQQADTPNDIIVSEGVQPQLVVGDGLQYQQQYIIRHEPQQPTRTEFQPQQQQNQQQQQQQQPQQALHRHQVYYTSDLPVDAQVVLQQAQQIIDASLMQQSSPQHPQHQLVSPAHVLSQPTVIHPAQQPPPQPPPQSATSQLGPSQNQQPAPQLTRASPQLIQHLQQQHQQQIQLQLQQQQQQQLQHQLQQQQHLQPQQIQHQQVVMHAAYINQQGTPTRQPSPRLLNQSISTPGLTLVRTPVRTARPRRPPTRPSLASPGGAQVTRHLNPQLQQAQNSSTAVGRGVSPATASPAGARGGRAARPGSPRVLPSHAQHRPPRPRTPLSQTPHQLAQHIIGQQVHQQQIQQQINQLKLTPQQQQIILNQQNAGISQATRIITPQGTIVTQGLQTQMAQHNVVQTNQTNGPLPQQDTMNGPAQRASPHPQIQQQVKKVAVQPNNANEMDDLEESITAAIVQKHPINESISSPQQFHTPPPQNVRQTSVSVPQHQLTFSPQHFLNNQTQQQQTTFEQTHLQHSTTLSHLLMDSDNAEEERQVLTFANGQRITLAEYKRLHQPARSQQQQLVPQQQSETGRQTLVRSKEQPRPVQRVLPMQNQQQSMHCDNTESMGGPSEQSAEPQSAKMLIFLQNGEQRLITFTLPKESCTLQEVLEQVNVPFSEDTHIQCMQNTSSEIDYFVSVGATTRIEEMLENHPMLVGEMGSRSSPSVLSQPQNSGMSTPEKSQCPDTLSNNSPESPERRSPPPRYVDGMLAVCKSCGYTGFDFSRCQRCKRVFTEEPKSVPSKKLEQKKKEPEKNILDKQNSCSSDGIKLNLLKTTVKALNSKSDKKPPRVRKPKAKPDPEPVILTLSSDEEDSNSSMLSSQHEQSINMKEPTLSEIEGTPDYIGMDHMDDGSREEINPSSSQGIVTSLNCRTIRIGSYRYTPKEKVHVSSKGIKIVAPSLKNESREVALQIQLKEIVRILVHFGKGLPVIFLYTMSKCGVYVRKALDMIDETGPYYNPMSVVDPYKRITLLPECISDDAKIALKALFGKVMDELNAREANDILVRTCPKDSNNVAKITTRSMSTSNSGAKSANPAEIRQILIYPPGKGGIPINTEDYMCLAQDQFLNDVIIDFYLKYLVHDILTHGQREKTHIFSTFFYKRLTTKPSKVNKISNPHEWDNSLSPAQKRHARVKTWTKNVNIFEKDFIVVPINENCHWFVAIICFPSLEGCRSMIDNRTLNPQLIKKRERRSSIQIGNTTITPLTKQEQQLTLNCDSDNLSERDEAEADESDLDMQCDSDEDETEKTEKKVEQTPIGRNEPIKQPCILIFDSLAGASRSRVVATLRDYLTCEYQAKICKNKVFNKDNIKGSCPKIPQQNNFTDCGLYLLQYVEQFFKDPILDYTLPIKQLANWFDEIVVTRKREEISMLLKALMHRYNPDSHLSLPDITFPTLNGKLIESEEQQDETLDGDKGNSSKTSKPDSKDSETPTLTFVKQMPTGDIVVKRNFSDTSDTIHLRKTIRLSSDSENRSVVSIKKNENENKILIPLKLHTSDLVVKDFQNTLLVTKNKTLGDKKYSVHNQNVSSVNCIRQNASDSDSNMFLKTRRINKLEDMNESNKKFKRNEC